MVQPPLTREGKHESADSRALGHFGPIPAAEVIGSAWRMWRTPALRPGATSSLGLRADVDPSELYTRQDLHDLAVVEHEQRHCGQSGRLLALITVVVGHRGWRSVDVSRPGDGLILKLAGR